MSNQVGNGLNEAGKAGEAGGAVEARAQSSLVLRSFHWVCLGYAALSYRATLRAVIIIFNLLTPIAAAVSEGCHNKSCQ